MSVKTSLILFTLLAVSLLFLLEGRPIFAQTAPCLDDVLAADGMFVAPSGNDSNPGTAVSPKQTIPAGLTAAINEGKTAVFIAGGSYNLDSTLALADGVSLCGGYDATTWLLTNSPATDVSSSATLAVSASYLSQNTVLRHLRLFAAHATGNGESSYGLFVDNSIGSLQLIDMSVTAGNGSNGEDGQAAGPAASGNNGLMGGAGCEEGSCARPQGGSGGGNTSLLCSSSGIVAGGNGGDAALGDTSGENGQSGAGGALGGQGTPSKQGNWNPSITYLGQDGTNGLSGQDGVAGIISESSFSASGYTPPQQFQIWRK